ncbi:hypothetical protein [Spirosoma areae]
MMKTLTSKELENIQAGRPNWGDFASGLCIGLGLTLAVGGFFSLAGKVLSGAGTASGIACGLNDAKDLF